VKEWKGTVHTRKIFHARKRSYKEKMEDYPNCYSRAYKSPIKPVEVPNEEDFKGGFGEEARAKSLCGTLVLSQKSDLRRPSDPVSPTIKTSVRNRSSLSCWSCFNG
jgi:hypothetical protein